MATNDTFFFKFSLKSDPELIVINSYLPGVMDYFIQDSVFNYFPYAELHMKDDIGFIVEDKFFTENINMNIKLLDLDEKNNLNHNFYWSEFQMNNPVSPELITGVADIYLKSDFKKQDSVKSKAFFGNINTIVTQIMSRYSYPGLIPKMNISPTANVDVWYQTRQYDFQFIKTLSRYAYSPTNQHSPFLTFINSKGEFYFQDIKSLFTQSPVQNLYYGINEDQGILPENKSFREDVIQSYSIQFLGSPSNMENYNGTYYKLNPDGSYSSSEITLKDKFSPNRISQNKMSIRKQYLESTRAIKYYGIIDNQSQEQSYRGWVNNNFIDSVTFPYRMKISTLFNPKICAGKIITTEFKSGYVEKDYKATEYNGSWLVLDSTHSINKSGQAVSYFTLGKNSLDINKKHKYYGDFI